MRSKYNERLKLLNVEISIVRYTIKQFVKFSNGFEFHGEECIKFMKLFSPHTDNYLINIDEFFVEDVIEKFDSIRKKLTEKLYSERVPWNKGLKGSQVSWSKGLTKETSESVAKIAEKKCGCLNPMYGKKHSDEHKQHLSDVMKEKIRNGTFTPNQYNSNTHWTSEWNGQKYRSEWERRFHILNPHLEYEKIRIPYISDKGIERTYIVDFHCPKEKILYEVKPSKHKEILNNQLKERAAEMWCSENGFTYIIVTEEDEPRMMDESI